MPDRREPEYANPKFARSYLRVSAKAEERGVRAHRRTLLDGLAGTVCEVGAGQGLNFPHYPSTVTRVLAVEPEPTLRRHAIEAAARATVPIEVCDGAADALPLGDATCDAVVASLVLCTVPDLGDALAEVRRVLKPGGTLRFYEHVRSTHRVVAGAEDLITPLWSRLAGGCHLNRDAVSAIAAAGFDVTSVDRFGFSPQRGLPPTAHVLGRATRSAF
jgi:ubiquinone/menaquinone biosynthesis C-methylase UbiE